GADPKNLCGNAREGSIQTSAEAPVAEPRARAAAPAAAVEASGLSHSFGELRVLERLDLRVAPREALGVVGPSGCGKSTLLELVAGLQEPTGGAIAVAGARDPSARLARCAYMPQR